MRFAADTFLWGLGAICQLHRQPFAAHLILQQFPPPYSLISLQQAAVALGMKSESRDAPIAVLPGLPAPFVAVLNPVAAPTAVAAGESRSGTGPAPLPYRLAIVRQVRRGANLVRRAENSQQPVTDHA